MYKIVVEIPKGWGGYFSGQKLEILGRRGGLRENSLRGGGMDIFWNYTIGFLWASSAHIFSLTKMASEEQKPLAKIDFLLVCG